MSARMSLKSDVLVIGGGIAGCATALQLARRGWKVTLLERDQAGVRASGVNFGGVRQNGRDLRELPIAMRARAMWDELPSLIGFDGEFRATGNLRLVSDEDRAVQLDNFFTAATKQGLGLVWLERAELRARYPWLSGKPLRGVLCPNDGHANPRLVGPAFAFAAQESGATIIEHAEITEGWYANATFQLRALDNRTFAAPVLVNCAGAWAGKIAGWFDEPVTLVPEIPQVQVTEPLPYRIEPVLGFVGGDFYLRQTLRGNILFGSGQGRATADALRSQPLPESMKRGAQIAIDFIPDLAHVPIIRTWTGVDGDTSDGVCVVGPSETHPGLFHAFGFNGHGFLLGPAVGAVVTELILDGGTSTDISGLAIDRFRPRRKASAAPARAQHPDEETEASAEENGAQSTDHCPVGVDQHKQAADSQDAAERDQDR
ncbi:NAD(P)/FAD-dependent oxidoreductase [Dongia deserti]|uniref:NAD(P)/FAD-dependent oxidoreductase n=1 Tax=Dongia deserti TaxID=2268030 RepID=UPI002547187F|nr:FAD-binding oxidoreductase [Dongia deserti]